MFFPLKQVLSHIEKNSEFIFVYYGETINPNRKVSIKVTNQPIRPVLDKLFKGMSVEYTIDNRQITLKKVAQKKDDKRIANTNRNLYLLTLLLVVNLQFSIIL